MRQIEDVGKRVAKAVRQFWRIRQQQARKQGVAGRKDQGARSAVTGGAQMDGFVDLVSDLILAAGIDEKCLFRSRCLELPGFFRPTKEWDLLAVKNGKKQSWQVQPYALWRLGEMDDSGSARIVGATYDPASGRVYITEAFGEEPAVHVYQITAESIPSLILHGAPGSQAIHLTWDVDATLPPTSTWRIGYYSQTVASSVYVSGLVSSTRAYSLTNLTNYAWYTVTLNAMLNGMPFLTDTVRVMPTDRFVYLPLTMREH